MNILIAISLDFSSTHLCSVPLFCSAAVIKVFSISRDFYCCDIGLRYIYGYRCSQIQRLLGNAQ